MKSLLLIGLAAACRAGAPAATPTNLVLGAPAPVDLAYLASPDIAASPAVPMACPARDVATDPPPASCAPHIVATGTGGALLRAWEFPECQIGSVRDDGAVVVVAAPNNVYLVTEPTSPATPVTRRSVREANAGGAAFALDVLDDGTALLALADQVHCERLPSRPEPDDIAGTADGRIAYWTRDPRGKHLVERTPDGVYHAFPTVDGALTTELFAQGGRVAFGYRSGGGAETEIGYYDDTDRHLHPIRRDLAASSLQLVPGAAPGEPPTALYEDGDKLYIDQPDLAHGAHRLVANRKGHECAEGDPYGSKPSDDMFVHHTPPVLFRTLAGGLFLGYGETHGTCTYALTRGYGYFDRGKPVPHGDEALLAHPPPPPPHWRATARVERAQLVLVPIVGGRFDDKMGVTLPARELSYSGPWDFHPIVSAHRVRLAIGNLFVDLDPAQLPAREPLETRWTSPPVREAPPSAPIATIPVVPPAEPFPPLRTGDMAAALAVTAQPMRTVKTKPYSTCQITTRTTSAPDEVDRQVVLHCDQARAIVLAAAPDGRAVFTQFAQGGATPRITIDKAGAVEVVDVSKLPYEDQQVRFEGGAFVYGYHRPPGAPAVPGGMMVYDNDATSVFTTHYEHDGNALQRAHVDKGQWVWEPAFPTGRTPPKGSMSWPVIMPHPGAPPTVAYVGDARDVGDIHVRVPGGATVDLPAWGHDPRRGDYRIAELSAVELPGAVLPVVAAKVDAVVEVGFPASATAYTMRAIAGTPQYPNPALPPPPAGAAGAAVPHRSSRGPACSETLAARDREQLYSPQVFAWPGETGVAGVAYLSTRVHEQLRWSVVPPAKGKGDATCGWVVDQHVAMNELAVTRVDAHGGREVVRVPVDYNPGDGFHGSTLLATRVGTMLHTVATSYGTATYTRIALAKLGAGH